MEHKTKKLKKAKPSRKKLRYKFLNCVSAEMAMRVIVSSVSASIKRILKNKTATEEQAKLAATALTLSHWAKFPLTLPDSSFRIGFNSLRESQYKLSYIKPVTFNSPLTTYISNKMKKIRKPKYFFSRQIYKKMLINSPVTLKIPEFKQNLNSFRRVLPKLKIRESQHLTEETKQLKRIKIKSNKITSRTLRNKLESGHHTKISFNRPSIFTTKYHKYRKTAALASHQSYTNTDYSRTLDQHKRTISLNNTLSLRQSSKMHTPSVEYSKMTITAKQIKI